MIRGKCKMIEQLLNAISELGMSEIQNVLISAGENVLRNYKDSSTWEKLFVDTGDFFIKTVSDEYDYVHDLQGTSN